MLIIREAQMAVFEERTLRQFEERALDRLAFRLPEEVAAMGLPAASEAVRRGIALAASHGIETEPAVERFLGLMLRLGDDFESLLAHPEARAILDDASLPDDVRLQLLSVELTGELSEG